ncbi:hypothetical protein Taro_006426 [Colocasia esculenta]|uniref:Uncharacterized protein n=1 Tax=Colocasia esculenta TaxID=4460 RepID=A0A843TR53_COLES|nr:hypothetical protein [Colocasia esculenta]
MRPRPSANASKGVVAIVGAGPNLGRSVARNICDLLINSGALHARPPALALAANLSRLADEIAWEAKAQVFAIRIDCADPKSVREAFEGVLSLGFVEVLVYNACTRIPSQPTRLADISVESFEKSLAVSAVGAFHSAQQVIPGMVERGKGTIIFTGCSASVTGFAGYSELSCGKFALRGLSQCLAREFQQAGVHVAHVVIDGAIGAPGYVSCPCGKHLYVGDVRTINYLQFK